MRREKSRMGEIKEYQKKKRGRLESTRMSEKGHVKKFLEVGT